MHFLSVPGLAWQACLKKRDVGLELLTDADMLVMVEKGISGTMCHSIHRHVKANNRYIRDYEPNRKNIISHVLGQEHYERAGNVTKISCGGFCIGLIKVL